ncbi:MAG: hypothetical protein ACXWLC_12155, partial [Rhizomicrobium sp.]
AFLACASAQAQDKAELPHLFTHESYVEQVLRRSSLQVDDPKAVFAFVLNSLPDRVKVYPTENYYYFRFVHNGAQYAGNVRLDNETRDQGKIHVAYSIDFAEWKDEDPAMHQLLGQDDGVIVEKLDRLVYRVSYGSKSVVFELNDLADIVPPPGALAPDERYIGPIFDDSAVRFFLVYNTRLKLFHYILDESVSTDIYVPAAKTDRILIGKRTGFAFYRDHRLDRKILIGVFEGNSRVNSYFDGPFDQLPDNFIKGEDLRSAILDIEPSLKGQIDRFGSDPGGETRYMISPYLHYRDEEQLLAFDKCATSKTLKANLYYACFLIEPEQDAAEVEQPTHAKAKATRIRRAAHARTPALQR